MKLIIGDTTEYLSEYSKSLDSNAYLVDNTNASLDHSGVVYTSLGDTTDINLFHNLILNAITVEFYPPEKWSDETLKEYTEQELLRVSPYVKIKGIDKVKNKDSAMSLSDKRRTSGSQLWCVGCSITFGSGIASEETWPRLVSKELKKEMSLLACPGSSIRWQADQILRSDIKKNDIVIWGLTSPHRFPCYKNRYTLHITPKTWDNCDEVKNYFKLPYLIDEEILLNESILGIHQVENFCQKIGVKLILVGLLDQNFVKNYCNSNTYIDLNKEEYIDLGSDNFHPGAKQHKEYTKRILEWIHTQH